MRRAIVLVLALAWGMDGAAGQVTSPTGAQAPGLPPRDTGRATAQTGKARVRGRVTDLATGQALRRAQVTLSGAGVNVRRMNSDNDGRFEFIDLPAGSFMVAATKTGYVNLSYGQRRPFESGTPVAVGDGQVLEGINLALPRGSVIVARIADDNGEPLAQVQVRAQRFQYQPDGQRRLVSVATPGLPMTDDRGELRIYGLMPGEYVISATQANQLAAAGLGDAAEGFTPTFYPGVASPAQATPVTVRVGEEATVQFSMISARLARVRGTVVDSQGRPATGVMLRLVPGGGLSSLSIAGGVITTASEGGTNRIGPDGTFTFTGVAPGEYTLEARPAPGPNAAGAPGGRGSEESGTVAIDVAGADIDNVRLVTSPGAVVTGRVVFEGLSGPPTTGIVPSSVIASRVDSSSLIGAAGLDPQRNGAIAADGRFELGGVGGRVLFNLAFRASAQGLPPTGAPTWTIKSVMVAGRDITDEPLDLTGRASVSDVVITMTEKQSVISGQVSDGRGQPSREYVAVILPAEPKEPMVAARYTRLVRPNTQGRFEVRGLRPGRYVAAALEWLEQGRQFSPEFQREVRRVAQPFTVGDGANITLELRLSPEL